MNLQQLEYILAVDTYRHFATAAEKCFVTQPTLSMMIQKLEEELGFRIFDRSKHPVIPTVDGEKIIEQARTIIREVSRLREVASELKGEIKGELRLGIIPTLAPYVLPLFIKALQKSYPHIRLVVKEMITGQIVNQVKKGELDAGLLVTPLEEPGLIELPLFYERFFVYTHRAGTLAHKKYVLPSDLDPNHLWLLEEGHCFRSQILHLCELRKSSELYETFEYAAGSIETLKKLVEEDGGFTILPELAVRDLDARQRKFIRPFKSPEPVREVSLVIHRDLAKRRLVDSLYKIIVSVIPAELTISKRRKKVIPV